MNKNKGITLIALVITIIVIIILAAVSIRLILGDNGIVHQAMKGGFFAQYSDVEEKVRMYVADKEIEKLSQISMTIEEIYPVTTIISEDEVTQIETANRTLKYTIEETTNKYLEELNLYWIDTDKINSKVQHRYLIDIGTNTIYDYEGHEFEGRIWHNMNLGVEKEVSNIPDIEIKSIPKSIATTNATIKINYKNESVKQYKIGTNTTTWSTYSEAINLTSEEALTNSLTNEDGTITVYAKGVDSAGNEIIETYTITNLDTDLPEEPVITCDAGWPIIRQSGVGITGEATIQYDTREDIDNYYSLDDGTTWNKYTGAFDAGSASKIIAKSVKRNTGLEVSSSKTITLPSNALGGNAYDNVDSTYVSYKRDNGKYTKERYIMVDEKMQGKDIRLKFTTSNRNGKYDTTYYVIFYDENNNKTTETKFSKYTQTTFDYTTTIPQGTKKIGIYMHCRADTALTVNLLIYEIQTINEPIINTTQYYATLTQEGYEPGYEEITIDYIDEFPTRLYKIGEDGEWKNYEDKKIRLELGETIYAKAINTDEKESRKVSQRTATLPTYALTDKVYDHDDTSYAEYSRDNGKYTKERYIMVDEKMQGKDIRLKFTTSNRNGKYDTTYYVIFYDENNNKTTETKFSKYTQTTFDYTTTIPQGTKKIGIYMHCMADTMVTVSLRVYEISSVT